MKSIIAIVAGGDSSEVVVSLKSAAGLLSFMDQDKYQVYQVTLTKEAWVVNIEENEQIEINRSDFSFIYQGKKIKFDFAYITIHGTP